MSHAEPPATHLPATGLKRRWLPIGALVLATALSAVLWNLPDETLPRGMPAALMLATGVLTALVVGVWFFFLSGAGWRAKAIGVIVPPALIAGFIGSIRRVEFSGDMQPTFDFRWQPDRDQVLTTHLAQESAMENQVTEDFFQPGPGDILEYRGAKRDGVVQGPTLAARWPEAGLPPVWRHPVGGGYAAMVNCGRSLITIEQRQDREAVVCYDRDNGRQVWAFDYPALFSEKLGGDGPRATPTIADGKVYALGATGVLCRLDLATGKPDWQINILEKNGAANIEWGMSGSPLVTGDVVIVNPGSQNGQGESRAVTAFDRATGELKWSGGNGQASYASPMLVELDGAKQVLFFDAGGLASVELGGGDELWRFDWKSDHDINAAQPLVVDNQRLLLTSAGGSALLKIAKTDDRWQVDELWRERSLKCSYANPVLHNGFVYGLDEGILACIELETGKRRWKKGRHGHGQVLLCEDRLVVLSETGNLVLVETNPEEYRELGIFQALEGKTWNNPILVDGKAYVRNHLEMACYDLAAGAAGN